MDFTAQIINMEFALNHKTQERKIKSISRDLSLADKRDKRVDYRKLTRNYFKFKLR